VPDETIQALTAQMDEMKVSVDSLERERDFYFNKVSRRHTCECSCHLQC
jgi:RP/EB family microtubule-associated protein